MPEVKEAKVKEPGAERGRTEMTTYGFIGTGHLGSMLIEQFVRSGAVAADDILAANRSPEKLKRLVDATGIRTAGNRVIAELSDVIFICVRPLEVRDVLNEISPLLSREKLLVSAAGDVSLSDLQSLCSSRLARAFPSMASQSLRGVTLLAFGEGVPDSDRILLSSLFSRIGWAEVVDEKDFATLADLTSCAPGYFAALLREFTLAAERQGIHSLLAERLVRRSILGTALLLESGGKRADGGRGGERDRESDGDRGDGKGKSKNGRESGRKSESIGFSELIESVATPGGITEAGVRVIRAGAPIIFDQLFSATQARHDEVRRRIDAKRQTKP